VSRDDAPVGEEYRRGYGGLGTERYEALSTEQSAKASFKNEKKSGVAMVAGALGNDIERNNENN
jgi:hypothetical protein